MPLLPCPLESLAMAPSVSSKARRPTRAPDADHAGPNIPNTEHHNLRGPAQHCCPPSRRPPYHSGYYATFNLRHLLPDTTKAKGDNRSMRVPCQTLHESKRVLQGPQCCRLSAIWDCCCRMDHS